MVVPFKDGADWLVVKLAGDLLEVETEVYGDVFMGGGIGCVGVVVVDAEPAGNDENELKILDVDGGMANSCPGEKAGALGLSTDMEA